jgi:ferritin-like protein
MHDRRSFLTSLVTGAVGLALPWEGGGLVAAEPRNARPPSDVALLNIALELEHTAIFAYGLAAGSGLLSKGALAAGGLFKGSHESHREALTSAIRELGGFPIAAKKAYDLSAFDLKTEPDVLHLALFLEMKAAHTYQKALAQFRHRRLLNTAGRILGDEVAHATALRLVLGKGPVAYFGQLDEGLE